MSAKEDYAKIDVSLEDFDNGRLSFSDYNSIPPLFFTKHHATVPFVDRYPNGTGFILAGGPSLATVDKSKLYLPGILTLGVNNSPKVVRPKIWTCVDPPDKFLLSIWTDPTIEKIVPMSHMEKKLFDSEKWKDVDIKVSDCPNVFYYRRNGVMNTENGHWLYENTVNWGNHSSIHGGRSVFLTAVRIMFLMGIRRLYLVGADFNMDDKNKYAFEQNRTTGSIHGNNSTYSSMNKWFGELRKHFEDVGFNVFNCNSKSRLTAFNFVKFDDAIVDAIKNIPNPGNERTAGMYDREDEEKKQKEKIEAQKIAAQYTEADRKKIKAELDVKTKELDVAKENTKMARLKLSISEEDVEALYNKSKKGEHPTDENIKKLLEIRTNEQKFREERKKLIVEKNRIWGIVK